MSTANNGSQKANKVLISSDSHVIEPAELLKQRVATAFRDRAPLFKHQALGGGFQGHPGGADPNCRLKEMETDGLSAEVLYPTYYTRPVRHGRCSSSGRLLSRVQRLADGVLPGCAAAFVRYRGYFSL